MNIVKVDDIKILVFKFPKLLYHSLFFFFFSFTFKSHAVMLYFLKNSILKLKDPLTIKVIIYECLTQLTLTFSKKIYPIKKKNKKYKMKKKKLILK